MPTPVPTTPPAVAAPLLSRESRTMRLALHADADTAFPLFGPVRETEWSPEWSPRFLFPAAPAQRSDGAVFTTEGQGGVANLWVMTDYDVKGRLVRYVILHPGLSVGELSIHVEPAGAGASTADVTYRFTAVSAEGNDSIARWTAHFPHLQPHWEEALNTRLATHDGSKP
jgi:hypothetical protein